jgi:hypothetical protein
MRLNVLFKKIKNDHQRLRDDEIRGWANDLPEVGKPFQMLGPPKDPNADLRCVTTSPVTSVALLEEDGEVVGAIFNTESGSTYQVKILFYEAVH